MPNAVINDTSSSYPSLGTIMNLARALSNDTLAGVTDTPGEGQIFTNNPFISPFTLSLLNSAIRTTYRKLRLVGNPTLIKDNIIVSNIPPLNSPANGPASPDPAVQVSLGFTGYFDGVQQHSNIVLPEDVIALEGVWQRQTGSNLPFTLMTEVQSGLPSCNQTSYFGQYEWRGDALWLNGSLVPMDLRLRYYCALPQFFGDTLDFNSTLVPILDSTDAIAYMVAVQYGAMVGATLEGQATLRADSDSAMFDLKQMAVRRAQSVDYHRQAFQGSNSQGCGNNSGFNFGL